MMCIGVRQVSFSRVLCERTRLLLSQQLCCNVQWNEDDIVVKNINAKTCLSQPVELAALQKYLSDHDIICRYEPEILSSSMDITISTAADADVMFRIYYNGKVNVSESDRALLACYRLLF
jgi:TATA-box binding protein (TBP) (component of TFIID and TFIIIB)